MSKRFTYKRIDGITYKMPTGPQDRENSVGLSERDMIDILHKAKDNQILNELLQKIKNIYFVSYADSAHGDGVRTLATDDVQKMTDDQLYDHNIILEIVKRAQNLGW